MARALNLAAALALGSMLLAGCSQTTYEGCSGPGGEDVQEVLDLMLDAVEQQSSTALCSLLQEPVAQSDAEGFVAELNQRIVDNGGIEYVEITQVDQGGSSKEFEVTNDEGAVFAEFSIVQNSSREYLNISGANLFPEASESASSEPEEETVSIPPRKAPLIKSDKALMETMECSPLSQELLETNKRFFGMPTRTTHIEVGEGLQPGEIWWIAILDSPPDDSMDWGLRPFLTTAPGAPYFYGQWIELDGKSINPWKSVLWDEDDLVVAQTALEKAYSCLED